MDGWQRYILFPYFFGLTEDHGTLYYVFEFPYIARPVVRIEAVQHSGYKTGNGFCQFLAVFFQKKAGEFRDILFPFPKRRYGYIDDIQPVIEVFPETACSYKVRQVFV